MVKDYRTQQLETIIHDLNRHELQRILFAIDQEVPATVARVIGLSPVAAAGDQALSQQAAILDHYRQQLAKRHAGRRESLDIGDDLDELLYLNWQQAKRGQFVTVFTHFLQVLDLMCWLEERTHSVLSPGLTLVWLQKLAERMAKLKYAGENDQVVALLQTTATKAPFVDYQDDLLKIAATIDAVKS